MTGMALTLLVAGLANTVLAGQLSSAAGGVTIACIVGYMSSFGLSWGYGAWLYIPEIMPLRVRGKAVGLCTFINWGPANLTSASLTPWLLQRSVLGAGGTLLFFGAIAACSVPFVFLFLPETKRLPLEQVAPMFSCRGWAGLLRFIRGNATHGGGAQRRRQGAHAHATGLAAQDASQAQTWARAQVISVTRA